MFLAISLLLVFSACAGGDSAEYESVKSFEFHFYPEEYQEQYSEASKTLSLEVDADYQLQIDATCDSGKMEIMYKGTNQKAYIVNAETPCSELLTIPANTTNEVTITVSIEPDTKGAVIGDLLACRK